MGKHSHSDSIALIKACAYRCAGGFFRPGLALSVTFGDTSPKGRGFGPPGQLYTINKKQRLL